jgi:acyl-CoA thioester hydrolase
MKSLNYTHEIRVRYEETDQMGVVYSGKYFVYFEVGRTELMRTCGMRYRKLEEEGIMLPVIETFCKHKSPAKYDDLILIDTTSTLKRSFIRFDYVVKNKETLEILSEGYTVHVFLDNNGKIISAPESLKKLFMM